MAKNLSELIDAHEKVHGKQKSTPNFPTIQSLRMTNEQKRKKQKRDWYHKNKEIVLKQQKNSESKKKIQKEWYANNKEMCIARAKRWNEDNPSARKLIVERHKTKNNPKGVWSDGT